MTTPEPLAYEHTFPEGHLDLDAIKVVNRLERFGHVAYFVGGCLRDLLLGIRPKDYDLVTSATPRQVKKLFRNSRIIGRRFKLVHVVFGGKVIELSTFRGTSEAGEDECSDENQTNDSENSLLIKSDNDFGTALEDAARRDFTVNALYYSQERKQLIDYVGGIEDLKARRLRTIGDCETRFLEDPVRMIRAIKLMVKLKLNADEEIIEMTRKHHKELLNASSPRILEEMFKLLESRKSAEIFDKLYDFGIFEAVLKPFYMMFEQHHSGMEPLVKSLSELDVSVDDDHSPSKPLCLASLLLPITANIFTSDQPVQEKTTDGDESADKEADTGETPSEESVQEDSAGIEDTPEMETEPEAETEETSEAGEAVAEKTEQAVPAVSPEGFVTITRDTISALLHETHGLSSVSRRDREETVRLFDEMETLARANEGEIRSIMRKSIFPDAFRLFKIGAKATGKYLESLEKLEEFTKNYNFYPAPRNDHRNDHRKHRYRGRRHHSRGRSR